MQLLKFINLTIFLLLIFSDFSKAGVNHNDSGNTATSDETFNSVGWTGDDGESGTPDGTGLYDGGHGLALIDHNYILVNSTNSGGDGASLLFPNPVVFAAGGSGLFITNASSVIATNSMFLGGEAGDSIFRDINNDLDDDSGITGYGIEWVSNTNSTLRLISSTVTNGINITANSGSVLDLSFTNTVIFDGINKAGDGVLVISERDVNSLESLSINEGILSFEENITIGLVENINLSGSEATMIASNGLNLVGQVSGATGSILDVYDEMILSGTLSGPLSVNLNSDSTNILELKNGYNLGQATFNALGSADILYLNDNQVTYSSNTLGITTTFSDFEEVKLSSSTNNIWELNGYPPIYAINGGTSTGDMIAFESNGSVSTYSSDNFLAITNNIIDFELYGLSQEDDEWDLKTTDIILGNIDGRDGTDTLISSDNYLIDTADIGPDLLYRNFEGLRLSESGGTWSATNDYSQLVFIDANNYGWTLSYEDSEDSQFASSDHYRNFDNIYLGDTDSTWIYFGGDSENINGGLGTNTILGNLPSSSKIFITNQYTNFHQVNLADGNDSWIIRSPDSQLIYVDGGDGVDTLRVFDNIVDSSDIGSGKLFRGFEELNLIGGNYIWYASQGDESLDSISGNDAIASTLSFTNFANIITNFSKSQHVDPRYTNFQRIHLTDQNETWEFSLSDNIFDEVNALVGSNDTLSISESFYWNDVHKNRYLGFDSIDINNGATVTFNQGDELNVEVDHFRVRENSILDLTDGSLSVPEDYQQDYGAILRVNVQTNMGTARLDAEDIIFKSGALVQFNQGEYSSSSFAINNRYTNHLASATGNLIVENEDLDALFSTPLSIEVKDSYIVDDSLYAIFDRRSLMDEDYGINVERGSKNESILNEIDQLQSTSASRMMDTVFSQSSTSEDLSNVYDRTIVLPRVTSHQRNGILRVVGERISKRRTELQQNLPPVGVNGPYRTNTKSSIWAKGYSSNGKSSADNMFEGYSLSGFGSVLGIDYVSKRFVIGVVGGLFNQTTVMDSSGEYKGTGNHISAYATYLTDGLFFESSVSVANISSEFQSSGIFDLNTDYSASDLTIYFGTGYIIENTSGSWTPEIGFIINSYDQDNAIDISDEIVPVSLDSFSSSEFQMRLGLTGVFQRDFVGRELITQVKAGWINTVSDMDEEVDFKITGGNTTYQTPLLSSAKSVVELGVGTQLRMNRSFSLLMGFDYQLGGGYDVNRLSAGLRYSF